MTDDPTMTEEERQIWRATYASAFALGAYHPTRTAAQFARQIADRAVLGLRAMRVDRPAAGIELAAPANETQPKREGSR